MESKIISLLTQRRKRKISSVAGERRHEPIISKTFGARGRRTVPLYDEIQRMVVELSEYFVRDRSLVYVVGSLTGPTLNLLSSAHAGKEDVEFIGLDLSESRINEAAKTVNKANVRFDHDSIMDVEFLPSANFVTALFAMQFLTVAERRRLLTRVNQGLVEGGGLIVVEKICGQHPCFEHIWAELYIDFSRRQGVTAKEILKKAQSNRGALKPITVAENRALLHQSGFPWVEIFFKWYNWAGFLAIKKLV
jgi:tRNA (cmo5U34)-methyltransferase